MVYYHMRLKYHALLLIVHLLKASAEPSSFSEHLFETHLKHQPIPNLSQMAPSLSATQALTYWKEFLALVTPVDPVLGFQLLPDNPRGLSVLFKSLKVSGTTLSGTQAFQHSVVRSQLAFKLRSTLPLEIPAPEQLGSWISDIAPLIEITDWSFENPNHVTDVDLAVGNGGRTRWIMGDPVSAEDLDPNALDVILRFNQTPLYAAKGSEAQGNQWLSLRQLLIQMIRGGYTPTTGQWLITSPIGKSLATRPGEYQVEFGPIGQIQFTIEP